MPLDPARRRAMAVRFVCGPLMILGVLGVVWADLGLDEGRGRLSALLIGALAVAGMCEYVVLLKRAGKPVAGSWLLLAALLLHASALGFTPDWRELGRQLYAPVLLAMALLVPLSARALTPRGMQQGLESAGATLVGFILFSWPFYLAQGLCLRSLGWMLWLAVVVKGGDIGAYLTGTFLGRRRLIPHVSPGKSWEGAAGGILVSAALGVGLRGLVPAEEVALPFQAWLLLAIISGIMAQISDLMESLVKQLCGAKDSSRLLPAHGGILDLTDSFLLSVPPLFLVVIALTGGGGV